MTSLDRQLKDIMQRVEYSVYLGTIMAAAGLPAIVRGKEAISLLSRNGYFEDGCERLLSLFQGLECIPLFFLEAVSAYHDAFLDARARV